MRRLHADRPTGHACIGVHSVSVGASFFIEIGCFQLPSSDTLRELLRSVAVVKCRRRKHNKAILVIYTAILGTLRQAQPVADPKGGGPRGHAPPIIRNFFSKVRFLATVLA